jgi:hypothetical protein
VAGFPFVYLSNWVVIVDILADSQAKLTIERFYEFIHKQSEIIKIANQFFRSKKSNQKAYRRFVKRIRKEFGQSILLDEYSGKGKQFKYFCDVAKVFKKDAREIHIVRHIFSQTGAPTWYDLGAFTIHAIQRLFERTKLDLDMDSRFKTVLEAMRQSWKWAGISRSYAKHLIGEEHPSIALPCDKGLFLGRLRVNQEDNQCYADFDVVTFISMDEMSDSQLKFHKDSREAINDEKRLYEILKNAYPENGSIFENRKGDSFKDQLVPIQTYDQPRILRQLPLDLNGFKSQK